MKTIRRLYFYAVAFISLEVVLWGVISLLRSIIKTNIVVNSASTLAEALSLTLVGVPIFLFHWLWAQRNSAQDEEEKTASLRAVFLYGALLATLIPVVQNLLALIDRTFLMTANLRVSRAIFGGSQTLTDNVIAIVINLLIAAYFWNILRGEWPTLPETKNFMDVRRLYRFIWMLYGLIMLVYGAQQALDFAFTLPVSVLGNIGRETVVNAIALLVVGAPIWFYAWRVLQNALPDPAEKESLLRLGILYLLSLGGVVTVLTAGANLLYVLLSRLFGESMLLKDFLQKIGGPISLGLPFGVLWAYFGKWFNRQIAFDESAPHRAGKKRLYFYILSLLGLAAAFGGVVSLVSTVINLALEKFYLSSGGFIHQIAGSLSALAVGLPVWLMTWRPMQAEALAEGDMGDHARRSIIRKSYLYFVLFAAVIGGMAAAVALVFTLINQMLGGSPNNFLNSMLNALQILVLFAVLLLYHLSALQKDGAARKGVLETKQAGFNVLVFDRDNGTFGEAVKTAFAKYASQIPVNVVKASEEISSELKAGAILLPASLALNMPENIETWLRSFGGNKLIVSDEAVGVLWMNDARQAAESAKALAEGQEIRLQSQGKPTSVWIYVAYVFAALFACQLLVMLITFGISLVTNF